MALSASRFQTLPSSSARLSSVPPTSSSPSTSSPSSSSKLRSFKTVLLGDASVGKSSLVVRFVRNSFSDTTETTIGAAFFTRTLQLDDRTIKFEIWDTAGQERFMSLAPMYYRGASAAVIVYDITNPASFERAQMWVEQLQLSGNPNIIIALAANKKDLVSSPSAAARYPFLAEIQSQAQRYAESKGLIFVETSAKSGYNVTQLFTLLARSLPDVPFTAQRAPAEERGVETITLTPGRGGNGEAGVEVKNGWCCSS
eukprot:GHVS01071604.1.p1 GENE.GHVS01071604.1~~GHVS01071604.1.p1  ORF type:complete len:256 (+),score=37.50 GHVS01071604.1:437-1204(+)